MNNYERRDSPPWETQDVPDNRLLTGIDRYNLMRLLQHREHDATMGYPIQSAQRGFEVPFWPTEYWQYGRR